MDIAAYETLPLHRLLALPYRAVENPLAHLVKALFVMHLDAGDGAENISDIRKTFFIRNFCSFRVHFHTFHFLLVRGDGERVDGGREYARVNGERRCVHSSFGQKLKVDFGVAKFVVRSLVEDVGVMEVFFLLCRVRKICVA